MTNWYENNRKLFLSERQAVCSKYPLLRMVVVGPGFKLNNVYSLVNKAVVVHGVFNLKVPNSDREIEYGVALVFPADYPKNPPELYCNDIKLPIGNIDRHIMRDGKACLGVKADIGLRWRANPTILNFLEDIVSPFLAWQIHYDVFKQPPPWGELSHGEKGILEFYANLLGRPTDTSIVGFMRLLSRKNQPKGHEPCPCDPKKILRNCHQEMINKTREKVLWKDVLEDLRSIEQREKSNNIL